MGTTASQKLGIAVSELCRGNARRPAEVLQNQPTYANLATTDCPGEDKFNMWSQHFQEQIQRHHVRRPSQPYLNLSSPPSSARVAYRIVATREGAKDFEEEYIELDDKELPEDTYGMALCSLARDAYFLSESWHDEVVSFRKTMLMITRIARISTSILVLGFVISLQILLLHFTKIYVCAKEVHDTRIAYSVFQNAVYECTDTNGTFIDDNCFMTCHGHYRGLDGNTPDFNSMSERLVGLDDVEGVVCRIPLTQPLFFMAILLIWTLVCMRDIKNAFLLILDVYCARHINKMKEALHLLEELDDEGDLNSREVTILGLTPLLKIIMVTLLLTRAVVGVVLLYIGCRWLLATHRFADLILNAVALAFILDMKDLLHATIAPLRNIVELKLTKLKTSPPVKLRPGYFRFFGTVPILFLAMLWTLLYVFYFQEVIPDYKWDAHMICSEWMRRRYSVS